jgi:DNA-binding response OmpR family regulator
MSSRCFEFMDREFIKVLLVSDMIEDHLSLRSLIGHSNWGLHHAFSREDAVRFLEENPIPVVICDCELPDGTWQDCWREIGGLASPPRLIVSSRVANNRLWGEVLNLGAYDLLTKPFEPSEVFRVGFLAWHSWHNEHARESKPPVVVGAPNVTQQGSCHAVA